MDLKYPNHSRDWRLTVMKINLKVMQPLHFQNNTDITTTTVSSSISINRDQCSTCFSEWLTVESVLPHTHTVPSLAANILSYTGEEQCNSQLQLFKDVSEGMVASLSITEYCLLNMKCINTGYTFASFNPYENMFLLLLSCNPICKVRSRNTD